MRDTSRKKTHHRRSTPRWYDEPAPRGTYRSLFKWGSPDETKHPNDRLVEYMKEYFGMTDADFAHPRKIGLEKVDGQYAPRLSKAQLSAMAGIVPRHNFRTDVYERIRASYGKTMIDAIRLRNHEIENLPDAVIYPETEEQIEKILHTASSKRIGIYIVGGRSSVTRGFEATTPGIALDMTKYFHKVLAINDEDHTATVQPGIYGPELEDILFHAPENFGSKNRFTCGHFPQSFEYSTVGGWIAALGSGQESTYYGDMKDLVVSQEYITPAGRIRTNRYVAEAAGPRLDGIFCGSEGCYGVLVRAEIKIFRQFPGRTRFSYMFRNWESAVAAAREVHQAEIGRPAVFRISDAEETEIGMKLYGVDGNLLDKWIRSRGYRVGERCLMIGSAAGDPVYARMVGRSIRRICRKYGAMSLTSLPVKGWEKGRFRDPYMRDDLQDFGILIDTLECSVRWSNILEVHRAVRQCVKKRKRTILMCHASHFYPQGTNLYFIFIARMESKSEYLALQREIIDAIYQSGASLSHHHGIGRMLSPWFESYIGSDELELLRAIKRHLDPRGILNPGGTLAMDMVWNDFSLDGSNPGTKGDLSEKSDQGKHPRNRKKK